METAMIFAMIGTISSLTLIAYSIFTDDDGRKAAEMIGKIFGVVCVAGFVFGCALFFVGGV